MNLSPKDLLTGTVELASLPEIFTRVNAMIDDPRSSAADIGKIVGEDPALTTRLLKIVNSPFYGFPSCIETISRAITIVGTRELRDLILATTVIKLFAGLPNELVTMESFWRHSVSCALLASSLASHRRDETAESLFVAGLIHDVGHLIIYRKVPELAREALTRAKYHEVELYRAERDVLGFDHADVGGELLRMWRLPAKLQETVAFHHAPERAKEFPVETAIVHLANEIANTVTLDTGEISGEMPLESHAWKSAGLSTDVLESALADAGRKFEETLHLILYDNAA